MRVDVLSVDRTSGLAILGIPRRDVHVPHIFVVHSPVPVLWVNYAGVVTLEQRRQRFRETVERALETDCFRVLADFRRAHALEHDPGISTEIAALIAQHVAGRDVRIAWLVRYDHQLDDQVERSIAALGVATGRFQDRDRALAWLQHDGEPPAPVEHAPASRPTRTPATATRGKRAAPKQDAVALVSRLAGTKVRLSGAQYAALIQLVEGLAAAGMDEERIEPLARRMLEAMDAGAG